MDRLKQFVSDYKIELLSATSAVCCVTLGVMLIKERKNHNYHWEELLSMRDALKEGWTAVYNPEVDGIRMLAPKKA